MRRSFFKLVITIALLSAACGDSDSPITTTATTSPQSTTTLAPGTTTAKLWFVNSGSLVSLTRQISLEDNLSDQIEVVTSELLGGLTPTELDLGFSTSIPPGSALLSSSIVDDLHRVDLSPQFASAATPIEQAVRFAQLGCTISAFGPELVLFTVNGEIPDIGEGLDLSSPVTCSMLVTAMAAIPPDNVSTTVPPVTTTTFVSAPGPEAGTPLGVVFVDPNDILNMRAGPGIAFEIVSEIPHAARDLNAAGRAADVTGSRWLEVTRGEVTGWVHSGFITELGNDFVADLRPTQILNDLVTAWQGDQGGESLVAMGGVWVVHFDPKRRIPASDLEPLLSDPTLLSWGGAGCSPEECPQKTFAEAISDSLIGAYDDPDAIVGYLPIDGGGGTPAEFVVPRSFTNLEYLAVHDPGDNPDFDGFDWTTWYVYFSYEDGIPKIAGLSIDFRGV